MLTAATDDSLLDEQLGRLSFVSALFPEATLVFGEAGNATLAEPVSGGMVVHAWSAAEPYMAWRTASAEVKASAGGEVIGVYHGDGGERLVQVMGNDGLACLYGNLGQVMVQTGDAVQAGDALGILMPGTDCVFEVRRNGVSVDPALYLGQL
ncbi:MAG: M23 family metallopeptidase [Clostridia bacterium]|nr:M23 family metallopeptidase [Clostridia bacterium]